MKLILRLRYGVTACFAVAATFKTALAQQSDTTTRRAQSAAEALELMPANELAELQGLWSRGRTSARAVDPLTAGAAVVGIASGLNSLLSGDSRRIKDIQRSLTAISARIDALYLQQAQIIDALVELRVYFKTELRGEFVHALGVRFDAHMDRWQAILAYAATFANSRTREDLRVLRRDLVQTGGELFGYGPASYQAAFAASAILQASYELERALTGNSGRRQLRAEERAALVQLVPRYEKWLAEDNPEGLPATIRRTEQLRDSVQEVLLARPAELRLRRVDGDSKPDGNCRRWPVHDEYLLISGEIETGFTDRRELRLVRWARGQCEEGRFRGLSIAPLSDDARDEVVSPVGEPSTMKMPPAALHPVTTRLNAQRDEYFRRVAERELQRKIAVNVGEVIESLKARIRALQPS